MGILSSRYFKARIFRPGELGHVLQSVIGDLSASPGDVHLSLDQPLADGSQKINDWATYADLDEICNPATDITLLRAWFKSPDGEKMYIGISNDTDTICINVESESTATTRRIYDTLTSELHLQETEPPLDILRRKLDKRHQSRSVAISLFVLGLLIALIANVATNILPKSLDPYLWLSWPLLAILTTISVVIMRQNKEHNDGA